MSKQYINPNCESNDFVGLFLYFYPRLKDGQNQLMKVKVKRMEPGTSCVVRGTSGGRQNTTHPGS